MLGAKMSPIFNAFGGGIEKVYKCSECKRTKTTVEDFVSLSFRTMNAEEVGFVRHRFEEKKFTEGLIYKEVSIKKSHLLQKFIGKKTEKIPVLTIRDYLCHLNYTRNPNL